MKIKTKPRAIVYCTLIEIAYFVLVFYCIKRPNVYLICAALLAIPWLYGFYKLDKMIYRNLNTYLRKRDRRRKNDGH